MRTKILLIIISIFTFLFWFSQEAGANLNSYVELREVDKWTFNEYRYKITRDVFTLRDEFSVNWEIDENAANRILSNVKTGYRYLPDNLINENNYNNTITTLRKAIKYPNNSVYYRSFLTAVTTFVTDPNIKYMTGTIQADPIQWNAPLVTTLRWRVEDPNGSNIPDSSYVWWMDVWGQRKVIWTKPSISHTFTQEGNVSVFLDVKSSHKNAKWYSDTIPYSGQVKIQVNEKIASVILRVGWEKIPYDNEVKFSPDEARYGIIFDATSSRPASGTKFLSTTWDFGNGVRKSYDGAPNIERVVYANDWDYTVTLQLQTNRLDIITKKFTVVVRKPIASISASKTQWFLWDTFNFSAIARAKSNLSYQWEILNLEKDEIIFTKAWSLFSYTFPEKWRYSLRLKITDPAWNFDVDTEEIYINSKAPIASFVWLIKKSNKPNEVFFDATKTYDPDFSDDGKLQYSWKIDWQDVRLERPNKSGSTGFYTFSNTWEFPVVLTVTDPDWIKSISKQTATINSTLQVDFVSYPRVVQRWDTIRFVGDSNDANLYEWNFGDWTSKWGLSSSISHTYNRSGRFNVTLIVESDSWERNSVTKSIYVWNSKDPVAVIGLNQINGFDIEKQEWVCEWNPAYIINRMNQMTFSSNQSIDTNWQANWLNVSWTIGKDKRTSTYTVNHKFDEIGCYPIKLKVESIRDKTSNSETIWMKVENLKPQISSLVIEPVDINADPVIINLRAIWALDGDWVIQSYLWYYTTDADSDAQDFRITRTPGTTFVLPKLPGNYHFGVVLKDNNDEKVNSIDILGSNSLTLTGDNINTPIIDFETSDSSTSVWKDINFTANVSNVLWEELNKDIEYSWDFDWDGFYDRKTETGKLSYKYKKSWTFYPKVRVRNKWFSNTKTLTVDVANKLVSDFSYISVWNKYIFLDQSKWSISSRQWDLWDWSERKNLSYIVHDYADKKSVHKVALTVAEGTKTKTNEKTVTKNTKNLLLARKKWLNVFSYPKVSEEWSIILDEEETVFLYLWESKWEIHKYWIDYNIDLDSDLNGGKDDDIDNLSEKSYNNWEPQQIPLWDTREQTLRVFIIDKDNNTIDSKDITIIKNYIEVEEAIDPNTLDFGQISDENKKRIDSIKDMVSDFSQENRIKWMLYMQKLQDTWNDSREKTITVMDFEEFVSGTWDKNADKITELLKEILLDWEKDKSDKTMSYLLLKALIPETIDCDTWSNLSCQDFLNEKLSFIKQSNNEAENKAAWKEILDVIGTTETLSDEEKLNFKAILKLLVYSWVEKIPEVEKQDVADASDKIPVTNTWETDEDGKLMTFLKKIWWWALGLFILVLILMAVFWTLDFLKNRKSWETFTDFVEDKTSPLEEISPAEPLEEIAKPKDASPDPLSNNITQENTPSALLSSNNITKNTTTEENFTTPVPSDKKEVTTVNSKSIKPENKDEKIPDWLSGSKDLSSESLPVEEDPFNNSIPQAAQEIKSPEEITNLSKTDEKIFSNNDANNSDNKKPDWLSTWDDKSSEPFSSNEDQFNENFSQTSSELNTSVEVADLPVTGENPVIENTSPLDESIPDWLKKDNDDPFGEQAIPVDSRVEKSVTKTTHQETDNTVIPDTNAEKVEEVSDDFSPKKKKINKKGKSAKNHEKKSLSNETKDSNNLDEVTQIENTTTPWWLQDSLTDKLPEKKSEETLLQEIITPEDNNKSETTSLVDEDIIIHEEPHEEIDLENNMPDWLKNEAAIGKQKNDTEKEPTWKHTQNNNNISPVWAKDSWNNIPDWLKWSLNEDISKQKKKSPEKKLSTQDTKVHSKKDEKAVIETTTPVQSEHLEGTDVPDWLKESLTEDAFEKAKQKESSTTNKDQATKNKNPEKKDWDKNTSQNSSKWKAANNSQKKDKNDELWDDWMTVPDWLKSDINK